MFDKLEDLLIRYQEIMNELSEPGVADNPQRFKKLMKEQYIELFDDSDSRRKVYSLTQKGRDVLEADIERRKKMVQFAIEGLKGGN